MRALVSVPILVALALFETSPAQATTAGDICASTVNPCVVDRPLLIQSGSLLDFGARALVIRRGGSMNVREGSMTVRSGSLTVEPGAALLGVGQSSGGTITVRTTGDLRVLAGGQTKGRIDASAESLGGLLDIDAGGIVQIAGTLAAKGGTEGFGGDVDVSSGGRLTVESTGDVSTSAGRQGGGGAVTLTGLGITIDGALDAAGGDCSACAIDLDALTGSLETTASSRLSVSATLAGSDAGEMALVAANVILGGPLFGEGAGSEIERGGSGATLSIDATQTIRIEERVSIFGAAPDGDGGSLEATAGTDIVVNGPVRALANGSVTEGCGSPFEVTFDAGRDLVLAAEVNVRGGTCGGGVVRAQARGTATISGEINADGISRGPGGFLDVTAQRIVVKSSANVHANGAAGAPAGGITLVACTLDVERSANLFSLGVASVATGINRLRASGRMTVAGQLRAGDPPRTGLNVLEHLTVQPTILPQADFRPAVQVVRNTTLTPCQPCGNGRVDTGEQCDPPSPCGGCSSTCQRESCGNGTIDCNESCDDSNRTACDGCSATCRIETCGNRTVECTEQCDTGDLTACNRDDCSASCRQERCGNSVVECNEECDDGAQNGAGRRCDATCMLGIPAGCGNGNKQPSEECDDGNTASGDGCSSTCRREFCGDGIQQLGRGEECDDFNTVACDSCSPACRIERCGNAQQECGEECDAGVATATCTATCRILCVGDTDCDPRGVCAGVRCDAGQCVATPPPDCSSSTSAVGSCVLDGAGAARCVYQCLSCDDGNACNGSELCDTASGTCTAGTSPICDICTTCDAAGGCVARTGFESVGCHLDAIEAAIAGAASGDLSPPGRRKLTKSLARIRARLGAAASAQQSGKAKRAAKLLTSAPKLLNALIKTLAKVEKKGQVATSIAALVRDRAGRASGAVAPLRAGL